MLMWNDKKLPDIHRLTPRFMMQAVALGVLALLVLGVVFGCYVQVEQQEVAVISRFGAFSRIATPGLNFKLPYIESVTTFPTATQQLEIRKSEVFTADNQAIGVTMLVQYDVPPEDVKLLYERFPSYQQRIYTLANDRMKIAFGTRLVADVPSNRSQIEAEILQAVAANALHLYGVHVTEIQITDLDYSRAFREAIDQMTRAKAEVTKAEQLRQQAVKDAERQQIAAKGNSDAAIAEARGKAEALRLQAEAEAAATRVKGEAEADAIRAQASSLGASPNYVQYEQARRWNGQLPATILGSQTLPVLGLGKQGG
ncbi:SPFH domain-containing protein [Acidomonas methanolica]|nr:prohibitin family protein [Acidomonas methanolica]TCS26279.1 regulator of protease activity HflC (stomatin/prohibitin superfamily) [Acidomonas methanolica]